MRLKTRSFSGLSGGGEKRRLGRRGGDVVQITQFLRRAVQTRGGSIATECEARARTWREFETRVAALAGALAALGYKPGDRIGMLSLNSDRYL